MSDTIFIKFDDYVKVDHPDITIGDVAKIYSFNKTITNHLKTIKLMSLTSQPDKKYVRVVFSSLKVIEAIQECYPHATITSMGADDFLVAYEHKSPKPKILTCVMVTLVCFILFFGAAFAIMAFNNDISISELFKHIYTQFTGIESDNHTPLELGYSIGIPLGILIFYNHFGKKKITRDPTPIEIEMRLYENDINTTLIDGVKRKDCHIDVS